MVAAPRNGKSMDILEYFLNFDSVTVKLYWICPSFPKRHEEFFQFKSELIPLTVVDTMLMLLSISLVKTL